MCGSLRTRLITHSLHNYVTTSSRDRKSIKTSNNWMIDTDAGNIEDLKATEPAAWFKSRMTSHNLLVAVFTVSCVTLSAASHDNTRVINTAQGDCPSDEQREMVIDEMKEDIRNLLPLIRKWLHLMCQLPNADSILWWCIASKAFHMPRKICAVRQQKFESFIKCRIHWFVCSTFDTLVVIVWHLYN